MNPAVPELVAYLEQTRQEGTDKLYSDLIRAAADDDAAWKVGLEAIAHSTLDVDDGILFWAIQALRGN